MTWHFNEGTREWCRRAPGSADDLVFGQSNVSSEKPITDEFHRLYYEQERCFQRCSWLGVRCLKYPTDLLEFARILWETRPELIIETGTHTGGSALFFAAVLDAIASRGSSCDGRILTIDLHDFNPPKHPRIEYLVGNSIAGNIVEKVQHVSKTKRTMVILDSNHSQAHVGRELRAYAPLVSAGCYLVVEDTNVNGHPVLAEHGPGPFEAVCEFLAGDLGRGFDVDRSRERYLMSANPCGWLLRRAVNDS
jgi:cephalosporin hydroxylase